MILGSGTELVAALATTYQLPPTVFLARLSHSCTAPAMPIEFHARPRAVRLLLPFSSEARWVAPWPSISLRDRSSLWMAGRQYRGSVVARGGAWRCETGPACSGRTVDGRRQAVYACTSQSC